MLSRGNILVVDDEINLCRILSAKLAKDGYDVVTVHDGEQAVKKCTESHFDVVLLDLILPKMDGLAALSHIRATNNNVPVIIMTACENSEAIEQATTKGISAYLNKPFDLDNLVALVRNTSKTENRAQTEANKNGDTTVLFIRNQPITLEIFNGSSSGQYPSAVEDKDDMTVTVVTPTKNGQELVVPAKTLVRVGLPTKDAFYSFNSSTLSQRSGVPPVTVLNKPAVIYRTQRRQFARILANVPVRYCRVSDESGLGNIPNSPTGWKSGLSLNLSAAGVGLSSSEELTPGTLIYMETDPISDLGAVNVVGRVVRCRKVKDTGIYEYSLGVKLTTVSGSLKSLVL